MLAVATPALTATLMFILSKIVGYLTQPSFLAAFAALVGVALLTFNAWRTLALRLAWGGVLYLIVFGIVPLGNWLILPLEQHFAGVPRPTSSDGITGIIILGGFEDGWVSEGRGQLTINEASERLTEGVRLAHELPYSKVLFTGGSGALWNVGTNATQPVGAYFKAMGIADDRILLEGASRNTIENAQFSAKLVRPTPDQKWVLVTSAHHMPRAVGLFRKAGFTVMPWPVDYRTRGWEDAARPFDRIAGAHQRTDTAVNEWVGLIITRLRGRIDQLFPAP